MQTSKYLIANERDAQWGLTISTIGYEEILPEEDYPTKGHADGYYFDLQKGRVLNEYQLLYLTEGEGVFQYIEQAAGRPYNEFRRRTDANSLFGGGL